MAATPGLQGRRRRGLWDAWLAAAPAMTLALFLVPIAVGLLGTWLPAFGYLPALGGSGLTIDPWRRLFAVPGLGEAVRLSLATGIGSTVLSLTIAMGSLAAWHGTGVERAIRRTLAPVLAVPHAALAVGLAFLLAPSGWIARALSPWATGWHHPPDLAIVQDPGGLALTFGLVIKETAFLLFMALAAMQQIRVDDGMTIARSLGYRPLAAWIKTILPQLYPQMRLPVFAVLAFALSVVDMGMILGPATPPPLAPLILRWTADPDLSMRFVAAAGAGLQVLLVVAAIALWIAAERAVAAASRAWLVAGRRGGSGLPARAVSGAAQVILALAAAGSIAGLGVWSVAARWHWPESLPAGWRLSTWTGAMPALAAPAWTTLGAGLASTVLALVLVVGCLEHEQRHHVRPTRRALWLLYTPLLVPQIGFLFGLQVVLVALGLDGGWLALVWSHLLFVLPYIFLSLADPWRTLDERYQRTAACLGAAPVRAFLAVKLPMLLRPILVAGAVGLSVSVAQYLPTVFAGAGRLTTLTTEAVALASGADRRVIGVYAFAQALLPLLGFGIALALPAWLYRRRRGMRR